MMEFITRRRIEFSDTDLGGVVHFSRFFIFMETAEDELLRSLGWSFTSSGQGAEGGWPKVAASCEYLRSARYGDDLEIRMNLARASRSTLTWSFEFRRADELLAKGSTTSVCCVRRPEGGFRSAPIPEALARALGAA